MKLNFISLVCVLMLPGAILAQQQASALRDPKAISLLQQCSAAMGSPAVDSTVISSGTVVPAHPTDSATPLVLKSKGGSSTRWELTRPTGQETAVLYEGHGKTRHNAGETSLPTWQTRYARQEHFPALLCLLEAQRPNMDVSYVGLEDVGGTSAHHIRVSAGAPGKTKAADSAERIISDFHIFLDARSFTVVKTMRYIFSPEAIENRSVFETYYTNYKLVAGILMPFTITNYLGGQKVQDVTFDKIQLNSAIQDSEFSQ